MGLYSHFWSHFRVLVAFFMNPEHTISEFWVIFYFS
nr:MAG TPA: hypothetical protein [Caudoviricetes sp.]